VGRAIVDLFKKAQLPAYPRAVVLTPGHAVTQDEDGTYYVPKKDLVGVVQAAPQTRRLRIAEGLKEARVLTRELQTFRSKVAVATANESFEDWRERPHDDLVLAVALAVWFAERVCRGEATAGGKTLTACLFDEDFVW
jgi:hypothetical protein